MYSSCRRNSPGDACAPRARGDSASEAEAVPCGAEGEEAAGGQEVAEVRDAVSIPRSLLLIWLRHWSRPRVWVVQSSGSSAKSWRCVVLLNSLRSAPGEGGPADFGFWAVPAVQVQIGACTVLLALVFNGASLLLLPCRGTLGSQSTSASAGLHFDALGGCAAHSLVAAKRILISPSR